MNILNLVSDILFPPICLVCHKYLESKKREDYICENCFLKIPINNSFFCTACSARRMKLSLVCHKNEPLVLAAASTYKDEAVKNLIWQLKFQKQKAAAIPLSKILLKYLDNLKDLFELDKFEAIIPVPLHTKREKERGFNQSELIAQRIYSHKKTMDLLRRIRNTETQTDKDAENRRLNLENAFEVMDSTKISGKNFILLDDVYTSGATLRSAARALKTAGARKIIGLVVARV